jgi:hypothetical protein
MPSSTFAWAGLAAVLASSAATTATAQADTSRVIPAGADGRFQLKLDETDQLKGHSKEKVAAFRIRMNAVVDVLKSMPAVNAPPFPACSRLDSWLGRNDIEPVLRASLLVTTPEMTGSGGCAPITELSVGVTLNEIRGLPLDSYKLRSGENWHVLPVVSSGPDFVEWEYNGDKGVVLFEPRGSPFRAVSIERFARYQLDEFTNYGAFDGGEPGRALRARIESWTPEQRLMPACLDLEVGFTAHFLAAPTPTCPLARQVVEIDPAYLDARRPHVIQMISLDKYHEHGMESAQSKTLRAAVWSSLDRDALRAIIGR